LCIDRRAPDRAVVGDERPRANLITRPDDSAVGTETIVDLKTPFAFHANAGSDVEHVVVARRCHEIGMCLHDWRHRAKPLADVTLAQSAGPHEPLEGAVEPVEVIGIKDDSGLVTVSPFDREAGFEHNLPPIGFLYIEEIIV